MAKGRILVVDDEIYIVHILDFSLGMEGYEVITALDGEQALEKARAEKPDLVVLDIMMPRMDGFALLHALKSHPETRVIAFIFLTAKKDQISRLKALRAGVDDYITKPFDLEHLIGRVNALLKRVADYHEGHAENGG